MDDYVADGVDYGCVWDGFNYSCAYGSAFMRSSPPIVTPIHPGDREAGLLGFQRDAWLSLRQHLDDNANVPTIQVVPFHFQCVLGPGP